MIGEMDEDMGDDVGPAQDVSSAESADRDDDGPRAGRVDDDDDGPDEFEAGAEGVAAVEVRRRGRVISAKTRELFKAAGAAVAKQLKPTRALEPTDDEQDDDMEQAEQADVAPIVPAPRAAAAPAASAPPAPSLDPQVVALREQWSARAAELDKREHAIAAREQAADEERVREAYIEDPAAALVEFVKKHSGITGDDELADEMADLIVAVSARVHKVQLEDSVKSRLDIKNTKRYVKAQQAALNRREEAVKKQQTDAAQQIEIQRAQESIGKEISKPDVAKQYPFLSLEDNSGEIVWEVIEAQYKRDGTTLAWAEAAKRADDYLNKQASGWIAKRKHLLDARTGTGRSGERESATGDPTGLRRSRAITNTATSTAPQPLPEARVIGKWDPESHRAETRRKMRTAFAKAKATAESE